MDCELLGLRIMALVAMLTERILPGKMDGKGIELLKEMERLNIILDATHLCDDAFWQALDHYNGPVWASHNNCRSLVNHNRQYDDEQIKELYCQRSCYRRSFRCLDAGFGLEERYFNTFEYAVQSGNCFKHMDHICQLAGNALHVGVGSDLDGAFGTEQCPYDLDTIADLQKLVSVFRDHGYSEDDLKNIFHQNWINFLMNNWD